MKKPDGGAAFCSKCGGPACRKQGHQWLCEKHYRFGQMRVTAKRHGKVVPTQEELENLLSYTMPGFLCCDCKKPMNWLMGQGRSRVATLQHYRSGSMAIVCLSCNTRHSYMPNDSFRQMPKDHKYCPHCKTVKQFSEYVKDNGRSGDMKLKSWCKSCSLEAHREWRKRKVSI